MPRKLPEPLPLPDPEMEALTPAPEAAPSEPAAPLAVKPEVSAPVAAPAPIPATPEPAPAPPVEAPLVPPFVGGIVAYTLAPGDLGYRADIRTTVPALVRHIHNAEALDLDLDMTGAQPQMVPSAVRAPHRVPVGTERSWTT